METKIVDFVTFIKATREEAVLLADEMGGAEIHALHLMKGFIPAEIPVGYLVQPLPGKKLGAKRIIRD
jgi:hypothetical protein